MKTKPRDASGKALAALIAFAQANTGTIKVLAENLTARTGTTVYRQYVGLWLHPTDDKRVEPPLGMGLLLMEEGSKLMGQTKPAPTAAPAKHPAPRKARKPKAKKVSRKKTRKTARARKVGTKRKK